MHISDPNAFTPSTTALKKRKRDVVGGGNWSQDKNLQENISAYQIDFQDINMLASPPRFNVESTPISSQRQWLHLQSADGGGVTAETQKKRRILQPHSHNQYHEQQQLRPHSGGAAAQTTNTTIHHHHSPRKPPPPALMIPLFDNRRDPELSMPTPDEYDAVSPRTTPSSLPPPLLRPCHVCHRKPSTKVMLDAYADCELCGERACYICLRECNSLNCNSGSSTTPNECDDDMMHCVADIRREDGYLHTRPSRIRGDGRPSGDSIFSLRQRKVCSCCAVEGLTDTGEEIVWCLDCVRREETNHQQKW